MTKTIRICDRCGKEVSHLYDMPVLFCNEFHIASRSGTVEFCEECAKQACDNFNNFCERMDCK